MKRFIALSIHRKGSRVGRGIEFVLIMDNWRSVSASHVALSVSTFLLEVVSFMNLFNNFFVLIFHLFYLLFEVFKLLMKVTNLLGSPGVSIFVDPCRGSYPCSLANFLPFVAFSEPLAHSKFEIIKYRFINSKFISHHF